jgi:hypothetical protein
LPFSTVHHNHGCQDAPFKLQPVAIAASVLQLQLAHAL